MSRTVVLCGHNKCGTSWLREVINTIPSVQLVQFAELMENNVDHFSRLAQSDERKLYFHCPTTIQNPEALAKLKAIDPNMSAILIYREPVSAMLSMHNYQRWGYGKNRPGGPLGQLRFGRHISDKEFVEALISGELKEQFEATYRYDVNASSLRRSFPRYLELLYDDLEGDQADFVRKILGFIDVEPVFTLPANRVNRSMAVRSMYADRAIIKLFYWATGIDGSALRRMYRNQVLRKSLFRSMMGLNKKSPYFLSKCEIERLRNVVRPMVAEFSAITDLDLSRWGYEV